MKKAFVLFGITVRNMLNYSYRSTEDIKTEVKLVNDLINDK